MRGIISMHKISTQLYVVKIMTTLYGKAQTCPEKNVLKKIPKKKTAIDTKCKSSALTSKPNIKLRHRVCLKCPCVDWMDMCFLAVCMQFAERIFAVHLIIQCAVNDKRLQLQCYSQMINSLFCTKSVLICWADHENSAWTQIECRQTDKQVAFQLFII